MPRMAGKPRKIEEARKILPQSQQREHGPDDSLIADSSLQNSKTNNFCCFKPPHFWCFVMVVLRNLYKGLNVSYICKVPLPCKVIFIGSWEIKARTSFVRWDITPPTEVIQG